MLVDLTAIGDSVVIPFAVYSSSNCTRLDGGDDEQRQQEQKTFHDDFAIT